MLETTPAVFIAGNDYHIMVPIDCQCMTWVKVGEECFYDESNGILKSEVRIHRMIVPKELLDKEKRYTLCVRKIIERKPYFTQTEDVVEFPFDFCPSKGETIRAYHISDAHNMVEYPARAAKAYGDIDLLIMNGDLPEHCGNVENMISVYQLAQEVTKGNIPIVFSRGNHDMRGVMAEKFAEYTPNVNGNTYYTFRTGNLWGMVLDCGEDKNDDSNEYGNTICCHSFRKRQTQFIKNVIKNAQSEYMAEGVKHKIVICHNPFTRKMNPPFDIEEEIYTQWAQLLRENVKPDLMLCGHTHKLSIDRIGCENDTYGQPCTVLIGAEPEIYDIAVSDKKSFKGAGLRFDNKGIEVTFTDCSGNTWGKEII